MKENRIKSLSAYSRLKIGLLGGSFNPAHQGHKAIAQMALKSLALDHIWWLVSPDHPLKADKESLEFRVHSTQFLIEKEPCMHVSLLEMALGTQYTTETLTVLKKRYPSVRFVWIMGADNLHSMPLWKNWTQLFMLYPVAVFARPTQFWRARLGLATQYFRAWRCLEHNVKNLAFKKPPCWCYLTHPLQDMSSTQIRKKI